MAYQRVNWQSGTKVADGYVEINGTKHTTVQPQYSGSTPINPTSLNIMDKGIFDNSQDIEQNTQDIQENRNNIQSISNKINGLSSINKIFVGTIECKNLWPLENEIRVTKSTSFQTNLSAGVYTISGYITGDDAVSSAIKFYDNNENVITTVLLEHNIHNIHQTFNLSSACTLVRVYSNDTAETSTNKTSIFEDMQLEPGNAMTEYVERKKIIPDVENSLDSDSTENVPSIHAVNSKFAVLTGTISLSNAYNGRVNVNYPTGFNESNCVVIANMITGLGSTKYSTGKVRLSNSSQGTSNPSVVLSTDNIIIEVVLSEQSTSDYNYKVVLMKI